MFSVNYKLRIRIDLSRCASGVRILRAPWLVWWSILYSFHINGLLNIRHECSTYSCNTKAISYNSWYFTPQRPLFFYKSNFLIEEILCFPQILASRVLWNLQRGKTFWQVIICQAPVKLGMSVEEKNFRYRQHFGERTLRNHRRVGLRNRCGSFAGPKTIAVTFAEDFSTPLRARNEGSYDYCKKTKTGVPRSFSIRSLWVSRAISIHSLAST